MRFWFSVSTLIFSLAFTIYGQQTLSLHDINGRPGPGYFPLLIGLGLIIATAINVYKDYHQRLLTEEKLQDKSVNQRYVKDTFIIAACIALLIFGLNILGAIISMIVFCMAFLAYFNRGKTLQNLVYSLIFPASVFMLFDVWLQAGLPAGLLGTFY